MESAVSELLELQTNKSKKLSAVCVRCFTLPQCTQATDDELFARQYQKALRESQDGTVDIEKVAMQVNALELDEQLALSLQAADVFFFVHFLPSRNQIVERGYSRRKPSNVEVGRRE